jgi:hypothetical protein
MARIRTVKPEFFRHYGLYLAEQEEKMPLRVAFEGLWTTADREGRFRWIPEQLKLDCLPYDQLEFSRVLDALTTRGFIEKYTSNGEVFGWIPGFLKHQIINNRESASILPGPLNANISTREQRVPHACLTPLNLDQGEGKGREGKGKEGNTTLASSGKPLSADSLSECECPVEDIFCEMPCTGKDGIFIVRRSYLEQMKILYLGIDIESETLRAKGWLLNNPRRQKTFRGMTKFLGGWYERAQNDWRNKRGPNQTNLRNGTPFNEPDYNPDKPEMP